MSSSSKSLFKILKISFLVVALSLFIMALSSCHKHKYVGTEVEASCTRGEHILYQCKKCGDQYRGEETSSALGHVFDKDICKRCDFEREHIHMHISQIVAPDCTNSGYELRVCHCGDKQIGDNTLPPVGHSYVNDICEKCQHQREHVHVYKAIFIPPTCTEAGYMENICNCGDKEVTLGVMNALGHDFVDDKCTRCKIERDHQHDYETIVVEPTCTEDGYVKEQCSCGYSYLSIEKLVSPGHKFVNDVCEICKIERDHEHKYTIKTIQPTCVKPGYDLYECECGSTYTENQKLALGHRYVDDKCTECRYEKEKVTIYALEALINGEVISEYKTTVFADNLKIDIRINYGASMDDFLIPYIEWDILGEDYGTTISEDGVVTLGYFIGKVTVRATVTGENTHTIDIPIILELSDEKEIESISITTKDGYSQEYIEGEYFNVDSIALWGECENHLVRITEFEYDSARLTPETTDIKAYYKSLVTEVPITVKHKVLQDIEIMFPSTKVEYLEGEVFNKDGLVVKAYFENSESLLSQFDVDCITPLTRDMSEVIISYTYNGITKKASQQITVVPKRLLSITVDVSHARCIYTQGDVFDISGLVVYASYENFGEVEITNYTYTKSNLMANDSEIEISFTDEEITATKQIPIIVSLPYTEISHIKVLSPKDVSIIWSYTYMTNDGEKIIDNTAHKANGLEYDRVNGLYDIPMGAVVTATMKNPAAINLSLNGQEQTVNYQEKTVTWTMGNADLVVIKSVYMSRENSVIRFAGQENEQSFLFEGNWNGYLTEESLMRLEAVFADTEDHYYTYLVNGALKRFDEIADVKFTKNSDITVIKNAVSTSAKELLLYVSSEEVYSIWVNEDILLSDIPAFTRDGYNYEGWSLTEGGAEITQEELSILITQEGEKKLYIRFIKEDIDYSDEYINQENGNPTFGGATNADSVQFVGVWSVNVVNEGNELDCQVEFKANGEYQYALYINQELVCEYYGEYRIKNNVIEVISVHTDMDIVLANPSDLAFVLIASQIEANLIILVEDGYFVVNKELTKQQ